MYAYDYNELFPRSGNTYMGASGSGPGLYLFLTPLHGSTLRLGLFFQPQILTDFSQNEEEALFLLVFSCVSPWLHPAPRRRRGKSCTRPAKWRHLAFCYPVTSD